MRFFRGGLLGLLVAMIAACAENGEPITSFANSSDGGAETAGDARAAAKPSAEAGTTPGIPVVLFHEICAAVCTAADTYGISQEEFDRILTLFEGKGYHTISMADFARAEAGDSSGLPDKPLLLTFDDGREDAYVGADPILAKHGMQATMFIITNGPAATPSYYMSWSQIQKAAVSGRWNMQLHANAGHVQIAVAPVESGAFYANLECLDGAACTARETLDAWRARSTGDIKAGDAIMAAQLGDLYTSCSFAVPFGDIGQNVTNDPRIEGELRAYLDQRFGAWFTQAADPQFMHAGAATHEVERFELTHERDVVDVESWLTRHEDVSF